MLILVKVRLYIPHEITTVQIHPYSIPQMFKYRCQVSRRCLGNAGEDNLLVTVIHAQYLRNLLNIFNKGCKKFGNTKKI